jgi:hypothetical protein
MHRQSNVSATTAVGPRGVDPGFALASDRRFDTVPKSPIHPTEKGAFPHVHTAPLWVNHSHLNASNPPPGFLELIRFLFFSLMFLGKDESPPSARRLIETFSTALRRASKDDEGDDNREHE